MPRSPYSPEVRERVVRMYFDHRPEYPSEWAAMTGIAGKLGMTPETLRKWVRRAEVDNSDRAGLRRIERSLNGRPRKTLGFMTPSEKFAELVAATA